MAAEPVYPLHSAAFYLAHLQELPVSYIRAMVRLKANIASFRLLRVTLRDLCARLFLSESTLSELEFFEKSSDLYVQCNQLCEHFGLKIAPFMLPVALQREQTLVLTAKPNLNNDEDISYVQSVLKSGRKVNNRDIPFISRMQLKLSNYNILLRVIEGLGALTTTRLETSQLEYLTMVINSLTMPLEGRAYLKACLTYFNENNCYLIDYKQHEYALKPLKDAKQRLEICRYLAAIAARSSYAQSFNPHYALSDECTQIYRKITHQSKKPAPKPSAKALEFTVTQQIEMMQTLASEQTTRITNLKASDQKILLEELNDSLERSETLEQSFRQKLTAHLAKEPQVLALAPPYSALTLTLPKSVNLAGGSNTLVLCTQSTAVKELYPCFAYVNARDHSALKFDPVLTLKFYEEKALTHSAKLGPGAARLGAQLILHRLLLHPLFSGHTSEHSTIFMRLCLNDLYGNLQMDRQVYTIAALYYVLYRQLLPQDLKSDLPPLVCKGIEQQRALLTVYAWRLLQQHQLKLKNLQPLELKIVTLYILDSLCIDARHNILELLELDQASVSTQLLPWCCQNLLHIEEQLDDTLFMCFDSISALKQQSIDKKSGFFKIAEQELRLTTWEGANQFEHLIPDAIVQHLSKPVILKCLPQLREFISKLNDKLELENYFHYNKDRLPAAFLSLLRSTDEYCLQLRHYILPSQRNMLSCYGFRMLFSLQYLNRALHSEELIFNYIIHKARLISIPNRPLLYSAQLGTSCSIYFLPDDFVKPLNTLPLGNRLLSGEYALYLFNYCTNFPGAVAQAAQMLEHLVEPTGLEEEEFCHRYFDLQVNFLAKNSSGVLSSILAWLGPLQDSIKQRGYELLLHLLQHCPVQHSYTRTRFKRLEQLAAALHISRLQLHLIEQIQEEILAKAKRKQELKQQKPTAAALRSRIGKLSSASKVSSTLSVAPATAPVKPAVSRFDHLDKALISSKLQESSEILSVIGQLRAENGDNEMPPTLPAASATPAESSTASAESAASAINASNENPPNSLPPLSSEARDLIHSVSVHAQEVIDLGEFTGMCLSAHFMSCDVAVEMLNDYAYEHFDEPLFDVAPEENAVYLNLEILGQLPTA